MDLQEKEKKEDMAMDYAVARDTVIVTRGDIQTRKKLSPSVKKRQEFLKTHSFDVSLNKDTHTVDVKISEKRP